MFKINKIGTSSHYADSLMDELTEFAKKKREEINDRWKRNQGTKRKEVTEIALNKRKDLELEKIRFMNTQLNRLTRRIQKQFPNLIKIDEVYIRLINTSNAPVSQVKDALSKLKWIGDYCDEMTQTFEGKIKRAKTHETMGFLMKKYLGKVNSLFRKNKPLFVTLETARRFMNKLPTFEDMYTVSIGGFPNVGKSTLMKKMTGSNVEIQNYPFTTKGLMFSYLKYKDKKLIQIIDTPGLLGRSKQNAIEQRAELILREFSARVVFVIDFTESCGFSVEQQLKLLKQTSKTSHNLIIYLSKSDIFEEEENEVIETNKGAIKKFKCFRNSDELKEYLIEGCLAEKRKFDPTKLKKI